MPEEGKTRVARWKRRLQNSIPVAVLVVLIPAAVVFFDSVLKAGAIWRALVQPDHHHAYDLLDEYYTCLVVTEDEDFAIELYDRLLSFSQRALEAHVQTAPSKFERSKQPPGEWTWKCELRSTGVGAGFSPDQVLYSRSDRHQGRWIVGVDLENEQGEYVTSHGRLQEVRKRLRALSSATSPIRDPELVQEAEAISRLFDESAVEYYSAVSYKRLYKEPTFLP